MHAVDVDELGILDDEFEGSDGMESDGQDGEADDSEGKQAPVWRIAGYVTWVHARHTSGLTESTTRPGGENQTGGCRTVCSASQCGQRHGLAMPNCICQCSLPGSMVQQVLGPWENLRLTGSKTSALALACALACVLNSNP